MDLTLGSPPLAPSSNATAEDHPGRWIGGMVGAVASIAVAGVLWLGGWSMTWVDDEVVLMIGLLGMPVGFALGRAALPDGRGAGWWNALGMGLLIGLAAPPLGAVTLVLGAGALGGATGFGSCVPPVLQSAILLMYAIPFSFIAVVVTVPAGLLWGVAIRLIPAGWLRAARMPAAIARLGVRHAVLGLGAALAVAALVQVVSSTGCRP